MKKIYEDQPKITIIDNHTASLLSISHSFMPNDFTVKGHAILFSSFL